MFKTPCPACGAEVQYRSAASVLAVCTYCRSTLLRDAQSVAKIGQIAEAFEDYSPIQIGTCGQYAHKNFTVVGRIQMRYADGHWNEWYALFDDGSAGWLSDGSGQFAFTVAAGAPSRAPAFEQIRPGATIPYGGQRFTATDVRTAMCVAGEGELPFVVNEGWQAQVADFRLDDRFLSLDYSEGQTPQVFIGHAVTLEALHCQLLRDTTQIESSAGALTGGAQTLECPGCGSAIEYRIGMATHLVCASCHAEVDVTGDKASVLAKHDELAERVTTLKLGEVATINGLRWTLIGLLCCWETGSESDATWTEYLLFNAKGGFRWLVESDSGWTFTEVLNRLPKIDSESQVHWRRERYTKRWDYGREVYYAAGAFNWRVKIGDTTAISDYYSGELLLSRETTAEEVTWSASRPISAAKLAEWLGRPVFVEEVVDGEALRRYATAASWGVGLLNFWNVMSSGFPAILVTGLALVLLWLPIWTAGERDLT